MPPEESALRPASPASLRKNLADREARCRTVLRERPTDADGLCGLAKVLSERGDDVEAIRILKQVILYRPDRFGAYCQLESIYYQADMINDLASLYREWERRDPTNPEVHHMAVATSGNTPPARCSSEYVSDYFDRFAASFDDALTNKLQYRGHEIVAAALTRHFGAANGELAVLDAGCGTGLVGSFVRPWCCKLVGVDLSAKMLERARHRSIYDELHATELCEFLQSRSDAFEAILAADVLVYFGVLDGFITAASHALRRRGLLVFTVEGLQGEDQQPFRLEVHGRYRHHESYLRKQVSAAGLELLELANETIRWELGAPVAGYIVVARKSIAAANERTKDRE
jgi:predicted TPR repeat methyltransferase